MFLEVYSLYSLFQLQRSDLHFLESFKAGSVSRPKYAEHTEALAGMHALIIWGKDLISSQEHSYWAEGATERLAVLSLRKGIQGYFEPDKPEGPAQHNITLKSYTEKEKAHILEEWERNCEDKSIIKSAVIKLT